jgi:hypothetical protein
VSHTDARRCSPIRDRRELLGALEARSETNWHHLTLLAQKGQGPSEQAAAAPDMIPVRLIVPFGWLTGGERMLGRVVLLPVSHLRFNSYPRSITEIPRPSGASQNARSGYCVSVGPSASAELVAVPYWLRDGRIEQSQRKIHLERRRAAT